jgi:hypothetical protein
MKKRKRSKKTYLTALFALQTAERVGVIELGDGAGHEQKVVLAGFQVVMALILRGRPPEHEELVVPSLAKLILAALHIIRQRAEEGGSGELAHT